ncbi:MAG: diaminopropionate ammonia-lyase [Rhizobiales bacterium]|nr:diaminopropionate ammonia-lyase [Hyphomicrobiales bacterium]
MTDRTPILHTARGAALLLNPSCDRAMIYGPAQQAILSLNALETARRTIAAWEGYKPTPLRNVTSMTTAAVGELLYKDEGLRFALKSFKALGGAYAVQTVAAAHPDPAQLTFACATDGNHGRAVAWGAARAGAKAVIYLHETVSAARENAIAALGADIRRTPGSYDDAVRQAAADAEANGWTIISDTSWPGYADIPKLVMQGYALAMRETWYAAARPTHVVAQGGVGGFAAAILSWLWEYLGANRPVFIEVEPENAACLFASARNGALTPLTGDISTIMAGLECGEPSPLAWEILQPGADAFMTIPDLLAADTMRSLAGLGIVGGESGVAGLAGVLAALDDPAAREALGLTSASRILTFGTEGATDPEVYRAIVGRSADEVAASR